tara:strand:+ start:1524 stop:1673 length:150 start_codon:yes stop_codon:yes gene_type:complete
MFKTIVLAIDLEEEATWTKALAQAVKMAEGGELHLLAVVPDFGFSVVGQ